MYILFRFLIPKVWIRSKGVDKLLESHHLLCIPRIHLGFLPKLSLPPAWFPVPVFLPALPTSSNRLSRMMVGGGCLQELELSSAVSWHFTWVLGSDLILILLQASPNVTSPRRPASPSGFARHRDPKYPCTLNCPGSSPRSYCLHPCLQLLMMMLLLSASSLPIYQLPHFLTRPAFRSQLSHIKWPEVKQ